MHDVVWTAGVISRINNGGLGYGGHERYGEPSTSAAVEKLAVSSRVSYACDIYVCECNGANANEQEQEPCEAMLHLHYTLASLPENRKSCLKG
jgi:hypothetical protein